MATDAFAVFKERLKRQGFKSTAQRDDIARVFFDARRHISVEELYREVKRVNPRIGYATVYRTMKLLKDHGLASESHFHDGEARYESALEARHHDHMICVNCGKIDEFSEPKIETLQSDIARRHGFRLTGHKMELYGLCKACQQKKK